MEFSANFRAVIDSKGVSHDILNRPHIINLDGTLTYDPELGGNEELRAFDAGGGAINSIEVTEKEVVVDHYVDSAHAESSGPRIDRYPLPVVVEYVPGPWALRIYQA